MMMTGVPACPTVFTSKEALGLTEKEISFMAAIERHLMKK